MGEPGGGGRAFSLSGTLGAPIVCRGCLLSLAPAYPCRVSRACFPLCPGEEGSSPAILISPSHSRVGSGKGTKGGKGRALGVSLPSLSPSHGHRVGVSPVGSPSKLGMSPKVGTAPKGTCNAHVLSMVLMLHAAATVAVPLSRALGVPIQCMK